MRYREPAHRHAPARPVRRRSPRSRRNRRVRRIPRVLWLLAILITEIVIVGLNDPRFNVARIEVRGNKVLKAQEVVRQSCLVTGPNLFRTRLKPVRKRLLALPPVAEASVHRRLPNRILIRVYERQPMASVAAGNALYTVDAHGVAFRRDPTPPKGLPLVTGLEAVPLALGGRISPVVTGALRDCLAAAQASPGRRIARISIDQNGNLCFNDKDKSYHVRLGPPTQLSEKFVLLTALERSVPDIERDCEYIDVSCPEAPAWKPKLMSMAGARNAGALSHSAITEGSPHGRGRFAQD